VWGVALMGGFRVLRFLEGHASLLPGGINVEIAIWNPERA
jgi:hypothetical protein